MHSQAMAKHQIMRWRALVIPLLLSPAAIVHAAEKSVAQLEQEILQLKQESQQQELRLKDLEKALAALSAPAPQPAGQSVANTAAVQAPRQPLGTQLLPVTSEVPKSVEDIYREASGFVQKGKFSIEPGFSYTHYDTRELRLNGFLALDSIFLGSINLDRLKSDSFTFDLTMRYAPTDRWQFDANLPFVARDATYFSGGAGNSAGSLSEASVTQGPKLGDVSVGVSYKLVQEDADWPDIVWSGRVKTPTGKEPYGIKLQEVDGNDNLSIPDSLPTGNGLWAVSTGLSFVKTVDPAVLFASLGYTHYLDKHFSDISSDPTQRQPGRVKLGDNWTFGAGIAFALNDRLSLGLSYSQQIAQKSRIQNDGEAWQDVLGSDANAGTMNLGLTYAVTKRLSFIPNLSIGLTPDAANYSVSFKFPYNF